MDEMNTILPYLFFFIVGSTALVTRKGPVRLMSMMRFHSSSVDGAGVPAAVRAGDAARAVDEDVDGAELSSVPPPSGRSRRSW